MKVDFYTFIRILKDNKDSEKTIHLKTGWLYSRHRFEFNDYYFISKTINERQMLEYILGHLDKNIKIIEGE